MSAAAGPVVVTAVFTPVPGALDALRDALVAAIPAVHAEAGCILYAIHDASDGTITMLETWSTAGALADHAAGAAIAALNGLIDGLVVAAPTVTTMTPIPVGGAAGAL